MHEGDAGVPGRAGFADLVEREFAGAQKPVILSRWTGGVAHRLEGERVAPFEADAPGFAACRAGGECKLCVLGRAAFRIELVAQPRRDDGTVAVLAQVDMAAGVQRGVRLDGGG